MKSVVSDCCRFPELDRLFCFQIEEAFERLPGFKNAYVLEFR